MYAALVSSVRFNSPCLNGEYGIAKAITYVHGTIRRLTVTSYSLIVDVISISIYQYTCVDMCMWGMRSTELSLYTREVTKAQ